MNDSPTSDGGCRCGQLRFRLSGQPLITMACHCKGCQRMTASAYSLSALYNIAQFEILAGAPVAGGLHGSTRHQFCPNCLSWVYTQPEGMDDFVNVRSTLFDAADPAPPFIETMKRDALPWAATAATHAFDQFPAEDAWPALLADFAQAHHNGKSG